MAKNVGLSTTCLLGFTAGSILVQQTSTQDLTYHTVPGRIGSVSIHGKGGVLILSMSNQPHTDIVIDWHQYGA